MERKQQSFNTSAGGLAEIKFYFLSDYVLLILIYSLMMLYILIIPVCMVIIKEQ